ncbi:hypothetical protein CFP65_3838 [Kitasatospora sp. MMS16-BH015]|uniref:hypothetical protein n=1 Tax=Kitasatospora sp. MMS16-BH015 TaxID=2018025 RepID=UPI000CA24452|nr:hypothetical protein [Kitasatospora sp. MMS16-BH015]AUG78618.1 hypothetical protein CFP65_3838 [Kitasatospora sp. MMS16-BH015]
MLGALSVPGLTTSAGAAVTDLYVDNASAAHCSDAGHGTQTQPYCTVQAAADAAQPGQTVHIAAGRYPEQVSVTRSGTAAAPITFIGAGKSYYDNGVGTYTWLGGDSHALTTTGASHLRFQNMTLAGTAASTVIDGGSDLRLSQISFSTGAYTPDANIEVKGAAQGVTISRSEGGGSPFVHLAAGVRDTVIATNHVWGAGGKTPLVAAESAPGTVVVGNTLEQACTDVISLAGASVGATVENNVVLDRSRTNCEAALPKLAQVSVEAEATSGTKVAYNAYTQGGSSAYRWAGQTYRTVADFAAATGQGDHDIIGDTSVNPYTGDPGDKVSPVVDSADENVPGMTSVDFDGRAAVDDPYVPNSGTGSGLRDRGAFEIDNFAARYTPVTPVRLLDTRTGAGKAVGPGGTVDLPVAGLHGVPTTGLTAVSLNVTVTGGTGPGYLTVYPHGATRPTASNLNWTPGQTIANLVTAKVSDGKVSFYNGSQGTVHVVADLLGQYSRTGSGYATLTPTRILDTRDGTGAPKAPLTNGRPIDLQIIGRGGVPATDVTAVTLNVTATNTTDHGYLTVYPYGDARPTASNLNWTAGKTVPNLVTVPVVDGRITLVTGGTNGTADLVADVAGYFTAGGGDSYHALTPYRVIDTRTDSWIPDNGQSGSHPGPIAPRRAPVFYTRIPDSNAHSVAMNVTVAGATGPGFLTVYPRYSDRPLASNLNWTAGQTVPNQVVVGAASGDISIYNGSDTPTQVVVDVNGYYAR